MSWRFWIDRGGTFTDVVACSPSGELVVRKLLSTAPGWGKDPTLAAIAEILGLAVGAAIPQGLVSEMRLGTTVATNALLERKGAPVLLFLNRGLADLLRIGDQHRPELFALQIQLPEPMAMRVLEVDGRLNAEGGELEPLQLDGRLESQVRQAISDGYRSCAVALLHSSCQPSHECQLGAWLRKLGLEQPVLSHQLSGQPRLVPRAQTALVEAAVGPLLWAYLHTLQQALGTHVNLRIMRSSGTLAAPQALHAKDTIFSGPAGGMVGAIAVAAQALAALNWSDRPVVGVDMGGTSTDVFFVEATAMAEAWQRSPETEIQGLHVQAAMLPIHTVAAGGGSVVSFDGQKLRVGPSSAGADPGPAAYGLGGPATLTDANLLLGRLPVGALPAVFGPGGDQLADLEAARRVFQELAVQMAPVAPGISPQQVAEGAIAIAIETMAQAVRRITVQRGHDLAQTLLVSYGGACGQHACQLAQALGLQSVVIHPLAGVLSAYGIGMAEQRRLLERLVRKPLQPALLVELQALVKALIKEGRTQLDGQVLEPLVRLELRYAASEEVIEVIWSKGLALQDCLPVWQESFQSSHLRRYGYVPEGGALVVERILVELTLGPGPGGDQMAPTLARRGPLAEGEQRLGPAVLVDATSTTVLETHWRALGLPAGAMLLSLEAQVPVLVDLLELRGPDPVRLELYNHRFSAIAEQMGERLQQSARSVNIRERLDFSCALFDRSGQLVANAPHIPVHLGSMGESVVALLEAIQRGDRPPLEARDVVLTNNPYAGGTHLPDITAITPVFAGATQPLFFVASRGHHGDVGGLTPGSMPAFSRTITEEGLLLDNERFLHQGKLDQKAWRKRLLDGPFPVRNPEQLLVDLQAQVAANCFGEEVLNGLIARAGMAEVCAYMHYVQANAAECVRRVIDGLGDGEYRVELDAGAVINVQVQIDHVLRRALIDFSKSSPQQSSNFNAPFAVTKAVVLYVFRCLVGQDIPLNAGCFEPLDLIVPHGTLLNPLPPAAVVAGNVEVSQAAANALFGALGVQAAAQGTMNNLSFGNDDCQYYETICGGTGAGILGDGTGFAGASAVQSHMTNSRLTDPEILEARFPVRLEKFALRPGSGGRGKWPGGDGVVRQLRFLAPMQVVVLSGSRQVPPFGLLGGQPGAVGRNWLLRPGAADQPLPGATQIQVRPGDGLRLETPGGGGYGPPAGEAPGGQV